MYANETKPNQILIQATIASFQTLCCHFTFVFYHFTITILIEIENDAIK